MSKLIRLLTPDELFIAEVQLQKLKEIAADRLLTPDETKQYDILVKNLMLVRGQPTTISVINSSIEQASEENLMEIASQSPDSLEVEEKVAVNDESQE